MLCRQMAPGARNGESLLVKQLLDLKHNRDVIPPIQSLPTRTFGWPQRCKLRLPVAEDVRLNAGQLSDLSDLKVQLLGDLETAIKSWEKPL